MNEENLKKIYSNLSNDGYEMPEFSQFVSDMQDEKNLEKIYGTLQSEEYELPEIDQFKADMGFKKKDDTESPSDSSLEEDTTGGTIPDSTSELPSSDVQPVDAEKIVEEDIIDPDLKGRVDKAHESGSFANSMFILGNRFSNIGKGFMEFLDDIGSLASSTTDIVVGAGEAVGMTPTEQDTRLRESTQERMGERAAEISETEEKIQAQQIARSYDKTKSFEENLKESEKGIVETFSEGDILGGAAKIGYGIMDSSPYLLSSVAGGAATGTSAAAGALFFGSAYGSSIAEEYAKDGDVEVVERSKAVVKGIIESADAFMGIGQYASNIASGVAKKQFKEALEKGMKEGMKKVWNQAASNVKKQGFKEAIQETAQETAGYMTDVIYGDDEWDLGRAARIGSDAFIIGLGSGGTVSGLGESGKALKVYKTVKAKSVVDEDLKSINNELNLQSTKDNPAKEKRLKSMRDQIFSDIKDRDISDEDANALSRLADKVSEDENIINATQDKKMRDKLTDEMNGRISKINEILSKYDEQPTEGESTRDGDQGLRSDEESVQADGETESRDQEAGGESGVSTDEEIGDGIEGEELIEGSVLDGTDTEEQIEPVNITEEDQELDRTDRFKRVISSQSIAVKKIQNLVEDAGLKVFGVKERDAWNKLDTEKAISNDNSKRIIQEAIDSKDSFINRKRKEGIVFDSNENKNLSKFMVAIHAKERNKALREIGDKRIEEVMAKKEAIYDKLDQLESSLEGKTGKEKSSIEAKIRAEQKKVNKQEDIIDEALVKYNMYGSGMTDKESESYLQEFSPEERAKYEEAAKEFRDKFSSRILKDAKDAGLISEEKAKTIDRFEYYIPMKLAEYENLSDENTKSFSGKKGLQGARPSIYGLKGSFDSDQRVDPIVATINELTTLQSNIAKNNVTRSFANMFLDAKESNVNIEGISIASPKVSVKKDKYGVERTEIKMPDGFTEDNSIRYYDDGKAKLIKIDNKDIRRGLLQSNQQLQGVASFKPLRIFTNIFRFTRTVASPDFLISNPIRDFQTSLTFLGLSLEDINYGKFASDYRKSAASLAKNAIGKLDPKSEDGKKLALYESSGGKMSWASTTDIKTINSSFKSISEIPSNKSIQDKGFMATKKGFNSLINGIEAVSDIMEQTARFTAFKMVYDASIKNGDSEADAQFKGGIAAKEITINFNRKGEIGSALNSLVVFLNAGIQDVDRTVTTIVSKTKAGKRVRQVAGAFAAIGFMEGMMNDMFGDDDDEYEQFDEWVKERYINFKLPNKAMVHIPVTYGIGYFKYLGSKIYELQRNVARGTADLQYMKKWGVDVSSSLLKSAVPVVNSNLAKTITPTFLHPAIELTMNQNYHNLPIYDEPTQFDTGTNIRSQSGRERTPEEYKKIAEFLNKISGGTKIDPAVIDYNPEIYQYWVEFFTGSVGKTAGRMANLVANTDQMIQYFRTGENKYLKEFRLNDIPALRVLVTDLPEFGDKKRVYDMVELSDSKDFTKTEVDMFMKSMREAVSDGKIKPDQANKIYGGFVRNQIVRRVAKEYDLNFEDAEKLYREMMK